MSYITPRVQIQQEFDQLPVYSQRALSAFIIGPHYHLARYSVAEEKHTTAPLLLNGVAVTTTNQYQYLVDTSYDIPNVPIGGNVDPSYTKVYIEDAIAQYFPIAELGVTAGNDAVELVETFTGSGVYHPNRVRFTNAVLKSTTGNARSNEFYGRDVAVGDYVDVTGGSSTVRAKIMELTADTTSASIAASTSDAANVGTLTSSYTGPSYVASSGSNAGVSPTYVATGRAYYGYASKSITADTYTVTVTTASGLGDLATCRFSISSANGAFTTKTDQALASGVLIIDDSVESVGTNSIKIDFSTATGAFVLGSSWTVTARTAVTPITSSTLVKSGTFTGPTDMTYSIVVDRGGALYNGSNSSTCARLVITGSALDTQTVVLPQKDTVFSIGSFGVSAKFTAGSIVNGSNNALIKGDVYYIAATSAKTSAVKTAILSDNITNSDILAAEDSLTAKLYLRQPTVSVQAVRSQLYQTKNWVQSGNQITINAGITTYDSRLISGALPARLPIVEGSLYVEHRDLLQDYVSSIDYVDSIGDVTTKLNTIDPDNALAQGVYDAVLNSGGQRVYFLAVNSDDLVGYLAAIKLAEKNDKVYSFVPMTFDRDVQEAVVSHVNAYSTPEIARWRIAWLSVKDETSAVTYSTKSTGEDYTASVADNPAVLGTQFTYVTVPGADFLASDGFGATKLRANDVMRINFTVDADGLVAYDEYLVDRVLTNTTFVIATQTPQTYNSVKVELVRNYTKSERARNIAGIGGGYNNRRVRVVFPDTYKDSKGVSKPGYIAAAALAGLRSGVVPHQGLTNSEFLGAYDLSKAVIEFGQAELDTMAEAGVWIITQSVIGATPYVRHQLTTDSSNLNTSEDSITTNVDSMSYALRDTLAPFIGRYNINRENIVVIRAAIAAELTYRATKTFTARAGNQLTSFTLDDILSLEVDPVSADKINASVRLHLPYPLNYLTLKLIGGV